MVARVRQTGGLRVSSPHHCDTIKWSVQCQDIRTRPNSADPLWCKIDSEIELQLQYLLLYVNLFVVNPLNTKIQTGLQMSKVYNLSEGFICTKHLVFNIPNLKYLKIHWRMVMASWNMSMYDFRIHFNSCRCNSVKRNTGIPYSIATITLQQH